MSKTKYMMIDLVMLAIMGCFAEVFSQVIAKNLITAQLVILLLAIYRWNWAGILVNIPISVTAYLCAVVQKSTSSQDLLVLITYLLGVIGLAFALMFKKVKKIDKKGFVFILLYCIIGHVGQAFVRAFVACLFGNDFISYLVFYLGYGYLLGVLLSITVLYILAKRGGVLVEPIKYIIEQREEAIRIDRESKLGFNYDSFENDENFEKNEKEVDDDDESTTRSTIRND